jgi:hypothetical protein
MIRFFAIVVAVPDRLPVVSDLRHHSSDRTISHR